MSARDELARVVLAGDDELNGVYDIADAGVVADAVLASDWLARVKAEAAAEAVEKAVGLICHGEQQHDEHVRYCVPLLEDADRIRSEAGIGGGDGS